MRRVMILLALAVPSGLLFSSAAKAYDEEHAKNNFSHELVICAAFYSMGAEGVRRTGDKEASETIQQVSDVLLERARTYSIEETVLSRFQLALEEQAKLMHGDYANLSILTAKYKDLCKQVTEDPESRLDYWRQKN